MTDSPSEGHCSLCDKPKGEEPMVAGATGLRIFLQVWSDHQEGSFEYDSKPQMEKTATFVCYAINRILAEAHPVSGRCELQEDGATKVWRTDGGDPMELLRRVSTFLGMNHGGG